LANGDTVGADGGAPENTAVCKGQDGGSVGRRCQIHLLIVARPVPISARRRRAESRLVPGGSKLLWVNGLGLEVANSRLKKSEMKRNGFISLFGVLNSVQRYACTAMFRPGYLRCCAPAKSESRTESGGRKLEPNSNGGRPRCPLLMGPALRPVGTRPPRLVSCQDNRAFKAPAHPACHTGRAAAGPATWLHAPRHEQRPCGWTPCG